MEEDRSALMAEEAKEEPKENQIREEPSWFKPKQAKNTTFIYIGNHANEHNYHSDFQEMAISNAEPMFFKVTSIKVFVGGSFFGTLITGIQFTYLNVMTGQVLIGLGHQGELKHHSVFEEKLGPDELIVGVTAHYRNHVHGIAFETTKGRSIVFGKEEKTRIHFASAPETHLTSLRVGIGKAIRFLVLERLPFRYMRSISGHGEVILPIEPLKYQVGTHREHKNHISDLKYLDSFRISVLRTRVVSVLVKWNSRGITSLHCVYCDNTGEFISGQVLRGTQKHTNEAEWVLSPGSFLVKVRVFHDSVVKGISFHLNNQEQGVKEQKVFGIKKGEVSEIEAMPNGHLTGFGVSCDGLVEGIAAFNSPRELFDPNLFGKGSLSVEEMTKQMRSSVYTEHSLDLGWELPLIVEKNRKPLMDGCMMMSPEKTGKSKIIQVSCPPLSSNPESMVLEFDDLTRYNGKLLQLKNLTVTYSPHYGIMSIVTFYVDEVMQLGGGCDGLQIMGRSSINFSRIDVSRMSIGADYKTQVRQLDLDFEEIIIEVSGYVKEKHISSLKFLTNRGKVLEIGSPNGCPFSNLIPPFSALVGFSGAVQNSIQKLAVYYSD